MLFSAPICRAEREKDKHKFLPPVLVGSSPFVLPTFPRQLPEPYFSHVGRHRKGN